MVKYDKFRSGIVTIKGQISRIQKREFGDYAYGAVVCGHPLTPARETKGDKAICVLQPFINSTLPDVAYLCNVVCSPKKGCVQLTISCASNCHGL